MAKKMLEVTTSLGYSFTYKDGKITMKRPKQTDVVFEDDTIVDALAALLFDRIMLDDALVKLDSVLDLLEDQQDEKETQDAEDFFFDEEWEGPDEDLN